MSRIRGILFLFKCLAYIGWRILKGQTWNMMQVNLEEPDGRLHITYRRSMNEYQLNEWKQEKV